MGLTRLGSFIKQSDLRNSDGTYDNTAVVGISTAKQIITTKAKLGGVSLTSYKLLPPCHFVYVPDTSRRGDKISLGYNASEQTFLVSSISIVFRVSDIDILDADYLYMYFNRPEFDRYARFNSWGSAREAFSWDDMCDMMIDLPSLPIQKKYVDVYKAMLANQRAYESGLEDLKLTGDVAFEVYKHTADRVAIGTLLEVVDIRNIDGTIINVQGININKEFMPSVANLSTTNLSKYKVIRKNQFAANFMHVMRDEKIPFALYQEEQPCIISPAYPVFQVNSKDVLAEYIMLWLSRAESDRYAWFVSDSSVRGGLELSRFYEITIPLPSIEEQQAIANLYNAYMLRSEMNELLKKQIKDICPILIKGSLEEASA